MIRAIMIISSCIYCAFSYSKPANITVSDVKDMSLKECLDINYIKLGLYDGHRPNLNDSSYLLKWYAIDNDSLNKSRNLKDFIRKETGRYYLAKPPLKEIKDVNVVFVLCMRFYKSEKMKGYIENNIFK